MERKEAYAKIKEYGLQDAVVKASGKNFTMTSTAVLEQVINTYQAANIAKDPDAPKKAPEATETIDSLEAACLTFLAVLKDTGKLDAMLAKL